MKINISREQTVEITVLLLRVVSAFMFMQAGGMKLFNWFDLMPEGTDVSPWTQTWIGGVLEFYGGFAVLIGLFTQPVAFILSGEMAVAYWQFHAPAAVWPIQNQGQQAVLFCFIFLFFAAYGAGKWSVDSYLKLKKSQNKQS